MMKKTNKTTAATIAIRVPDARLWWPWELGEPNRYVVEASVFDGSGAQLLSVLQPDRNTRERTPGLGIDGGDDER